MRFPYKSSGISLKELKKLKSRIKRGGEKKGLSENVVYFAQRHIGRHFFFINHYINYFYGS